MPIIYAEERELCAEEFISVLRASGLAERRPVEDVKRIESMLRNANVIVTARSAGALVGVCRGVSDFSFCFYLSDLAVDRKYQGRGIGRRLIEESHQLAGLHCTLTLTAAPDAATYYPHIGVLNQTSCWIIPSL